MVFCFFLNKGKFVKNFKCFVNKYGFYFEVKKAIFVRLELENE